MSPAAANVLSAALALPEAERLELASTLLNSAGWPSGLVGEGWEAELQRRSDEIDAGTAVMIPWEVVRDRVHQRVFGEVVLAREGDGG